MIVTFYSFKGGVGRSMAMAACAYLFAQRGLRVLAIDFDLEAPGLERYFFDDHSVLEAVRSRPGLIDLVLAYKRALTSKIEFDRAEFKQWRDFVEEAIPAIPGGGSVDLMTSGRRAPESRYAEYALAVRSFDWQDFFQNWKGDRFFDWLRRELTAPAGYDIILVDSRTGVTEMGGVCAYQLADTAVLLCAANYQNLDGTRSILDDFRSDAVAVVRKGRSIEVIVVPARIESQDGGVAEQRERFFADFQRTFGSEGLPRVFADAGLDYRNLALKYQPELAITERLVDSMALTSFERLADALTLLAEGGRWEERALRGAAFARLTGRAPATVPGAVADVTKRGAGYDVLLEYSLPDLFDAEHLRRTLMARELNVWTAATAESSGEDVERAVLRAVEYSAAVVVGIGDSDPTPRFWNIFREARLRRKTIVPVILPRCADLGRGLAKFGLSDYPAIDLRGGIEGAAQLPRLMEALNRSAAPLSPVREEVPSGVPYPGGAPFSEDQAQYFFGRAGECDRLLDALSGADVVLLDGAAGTGKTSLVRAGLLPRVRRGEHGFGDGAGAGTWSIRMVDLPGKNDVQPGTPLDTASPALYIVDALDSFPEPGTVFRWRDRRDFVSRLVNAAGPSVKFLLIWRGALSLDERRDAVAEWSRGGATIRELAIEPLSASALAEVIEKPASVAGHVLEPGLADRLRADCGSQPGAIAQLQLALADIWAGRRRGWLTNKAYEATGGIAGRLAARTESAIDGDELASASGEILKNLIQLDSALNVVSQPREWSAIETIRRVTVADGVAARDRLVARRVIDTWQGPTGELLCALSNPAVPKVLKDIVAIDAAFALWRQRFASYVTDYAGTRGAPASLLSGDILGEAERWLGTHGDSLSELERALITASATARKTADKRRRWRWLSLAAGAVGLPLIVAIYSVSLGRMKALDEVAGLSRQVVDANRERDTFAQQKASLQVQLGGATSPAEKAKLELELQALNDKATKADAAAKQAQGDLDALRKSAVPMSQSLNADQQRISSLQTQLSATTAERDRLKQQVADVQKVLDDFEKGLYGPPAAVQGGTAGKSPSSSPAVSFVPATSAKGPPTAKAVDDVSDIRAVLAAFDTAYRQRDVARIEALSTALADQELRTRFRRYKIYDLHLQLESASINVSPGSKAATASVKANVELALADGTPAKRIPTTLNISLALDSEGKWIITNR